MKSKLLLGLLACSIFGVMSVGAEEVKCTCNKADCPCKCGCQTETMQIRTELFQKINEEKTVEPVKTELLNIQPVTEEKVIKSELQDKEIKNMEYVNGIIKDHMSEPLKQRIEQARKAAEEEATAAQENLQKGVDEVKTTVEEKINSVTESVVAPAEEKVETSVEMLKDKVGDVKNESFLDLNGKTQTKTEDETNEKGLFGKKK